jgi:hypothetical protein
MEKLHNEELCDLYFLPGIFRMIRMMKWMGHVARKRNVYRLLVRKRKRPLGRPRCRWEDNYRMDLEEVGWGDVDWIVLAQDRNRWRALANMVMDLRVP